MKNTESTEQNKNLAQFARAIGHPSRLAVLLAIARKGGWVEGSIVDVPELSQGTVITHLRELKRSGFITGKIFGTRSGYGLDMEMFRKFRFELNSFIETIDGSEQSAA